MRIIQSLRRRSPWLWVVAAVFAVGVVVAGVLVWGGGGTDTAVPGTTTTRPTTTATSSTSVPATTTRATAQTSTRTTTIAPPKATTKVPPGPVPDAVVASAGSGGGSGEVQVEWHAVANATGYRVYRTDSAGHVTRLLADIDIVTGRVEAVSEVVNVWSAQHTYVPDRGPLAGPDQSPRFQFVDVGEPGARYYRVGAYNAAGSGPLSAVTWGIPVVGPPPSLPPPGDAGGE